MTKCDLSFCIRVYLRRRHQRGLAGLSVGQELAPAMPFSLAGILLLALCCLLTGCNRPHPPVRSSDKLLVLTSITPLAYFAQRIGGTRVEVQALIPPAASPHTWEPRPSDLEALSRARILVLNGLGLEFWADRAAAAASNPKLIVVETAKGLSTITDNEHGGANPHVWLDPNLAAKQAQAIASALSEADPKGAAAYRANEQQLIQDLQRLDKEIKTSVATFRVKSFVAQHASWDYFAKRYGLTEAGVIESRPGKEPSPQELAQLVARVRKSGAKAVFAEPQFSSKEAEAIAAEAGVKVLLLDPLGAPPDYDYFVTMRSNLRKMKEGLG